MQKFLKWPLLTSDSEEQAVISVLSMVSTRAEPVSKSMLWLAYWGTEVEIGGGKGYSSEDRENRGTTCMISVWKCVVLEMGKAG